MALGSIVATGSSVIESGGDVLEEIGGVFGIGGGDLRPCEKYAKRAAQQAKQLSSREAKRAVNAIGSQKAQGIASFPAQSTFCSTGSVSIACEGAFDGKKFDQALADAGIRLKDAQRLLSAAGVETDPGCSEMVQVAKIVVQRATGGTIPTVSTGGAEDDDDILDEIQEIGEQIERFGREGEAAVEGAERGVAAERARASASGFLGGNLLVPALLIGGAFLIGSRG